MTGSSADVQILAERRGFLYSPEGESSLYLFRE